MRRGRSALLSTPGTLISPSEVDRDGSDVNLQIAAAALMGEEIVQRGARALAGNFEATATKGRLDRVVFDRKRLPRKGAAPAIGTVQLQRPTNAGGAGTVAGGLPGSGPPSPTRVQTNAGIVYFLTQPAVFGPADLGPITVTAEAQLAGLASQVGPNQTWSFVDPPFDGTITVTNPPTLAQPNGMAGAADEETDDDYKARSAAFFPNLRRGVLGAIELGLRSVPGVASVSVIEVTNPSNGLPATVVTAFVLDALGSANATLAAKAQLALLQYRALGIPVVVLFGTPTFVSIRIVLGFESSIVGDTLAAATAVRSAIVAALNNLQPGQTLFRNLITAAAKSVPGIVIDDSQPVTPAGTVFALTPDITFRTLPELIATT